MRYLVTGGAGFIGSHLVEALLARSDSVTVLDDLSSGKLGNLDSLSTKGATILFRVASVADSDEVRAAMQDCDGVFHLAAIPLVAQSVEEPVEVHIANTFGTVIVLNEARQKGIPVVFASSSAVYGDASHVNSIDESVAPAPLSPYAATKLAGEAYCRSFAHVYELPVTALRFFNVYGPRQGADSSYAGAISSFCDAIVNDRTPTIYGDGHQSRDFVFVKDVANALVLAMKHIKSKPAFKTLNVGSGESFSILEVLKRLTDAPPEFQPARPGDVRRTLADISQARRVLDYETETALAYGLAQTLQWFEENND